MFENNQKAEPKAPENQKGIDFHTMFYTLQGEGPFTGEACVFVRLAGCNLKCPGCDTEYTEGRRLVSEDTIVEGILEILNTPMTHHASLVVITGGEPFRQNIDLLVVRILSQTGCRVQIETNGFFGISELMENLILAGKLFIVVSPKTARIHESCIHASAFKYVIEAGNIDAADGLPITALRHAAKPYVARPPHGFRGPVYVNPMDAQDPVQNKANLEACRDSALHYGHKCGIQLHKIVGVE